MKQNLPGSFPRRRAIRMAAMTTAKHAMQPQQLPELLLVGL
jgi:hypothetical protein